MTNYHKPVLLKESVEALTICKEGVYVDLTFGGGGHSKEILKKLENTGRLYGFDQDVDVLSQAAQIEAPNFELIEANFRHCKRYLKLQGIEKVDGILADLGISSHQIDTPERGFSTRFEGDLDMRMNQKDSLTAKKIVNEYHEKALHKILGIYGEVRNAKTLAAALVRNRLHQPIQTIEELKQILTKYAPRGRAHKYFAQVFQALRIEVNDEIRALEEMLLQTVDLLKPGGRLVVISYHSLEDRLVKNLIQKGKFQGEAEKDIYGNVLKPLNAMHRKPILPSEEEIEQNSRARSAKMRIAERV